MFVAAESFRADVCDGVFTHFKREEDAEHDAAASSTRSSPDERDRRRRSRPARSCCATSPSQPTNEREGSEIARQIVRALIDGATSRSSSSPTCSSSRTRFARPASQRGPVPPRRAARPTGGARSGWSRASRCRRATARISQDIRRADGRSGEGQAEEQRPQPGGMKAAAPLSAGGSRNYAKHTLQEDPDRQRRLGGRAQSAADRDRAREASRGRTPHGLGRGDAALRELGREIVEDKEDQNHRYARVHREARRAAEAEGIRLSARVVAGHAVPTIVELVEREGFDLLVIGFYGPLGPLQPPDRQHDRSPG